MKYELILTGKFKKGLKQSAQASAIWSGRSMRRGRGGRVTLRI